MSDPTQPPPELRRDVDAALAARHELGPEYEDAVAAGLADRVEALVAQRRDQLVPTEDDRRHARDEEKANGDGRFVIALASLAAGIPVSAIVSGDGVLGVLSLGVAWVGIVGVNVAAAWGARRRR